MSSRVAFVSYSRRYAEWVRVLHANLERHFGVEKVFLDEVDLLGGPSYVPRLQTALEEARHLVLVMTPETLASPRVLDEFHQVYAEHADWKGRVQPILLVDAPSIPFLRDKQAVDFRDPAEYGERFRDLLRVLEGGVGRKVPMALPDGFETPGPAHGELDPRIYRDLRRFLEPLVEEKRDCRLLSAALLDDLATLETYAGRELRANALIVRSRGADEAIPAALRLLRIVEDNFGASDALTSIREALESTPRPEGPAGLLRRYLVMVEEDHRQLVPYFERQGASALLDEVYVRLAATPETAHVDEKHEHRLPERATLEDLVELPPEKFPWVTRRWVVRGHPGTGKTTFARHFARDLARAGLAGKGTRVPVFASLAALMREREDLLARFERRLSRSGPAEGLGRALDQAGKDGALVVLLDGFDEVGRDDRADALTLIRDVARRWPASTVIVTSRVIGYESPDRDFLPVDLLELDEGRRRDFLGRWFSGDADRPDVARADEALAHLRSDPDLWDLAGVPLYLTLMAILWAADRKPRARRSALLGQISEMLFRDEHNPDPDAREPLPNHPAVERALAELAFSMTREDVVSEPIELLEGRLYGEDEDMRKTLAGLDRTPVWRHRPRRFLHQLAKTTGILGQHDGADAEWRFWHKGFQEYWTARALQRRWDDEGEDAALGFLDELDEGVGRWAEPFALLSGLVASAERAAAEKAGKPRDPEAPGAADDLVLRLVRRHEGIGLRALATCSDLVPATFAKVLELTEDEDERGTVLAGIPARVEDPDRAARLLALLAQGNRRPADLYHIDVGLGRALESDASLERFVREARAHLMDAFGPVPEDLFGPVSTPEGEVPFWASIPAGTFTMGSPDDEKGRDDDEGPRHEVELPAFELGVVPVTVAQFARFDPEVVAHQSEAARTEPDRYPVVHVSWYDAWAFCRWAGVELPTEARWEYACRAGTSTRFWAGDEDADLERVGWFDTNSEGKLHPAAVKAANSFGLFDVHGNAWEWTSDEWPRTYEEERLSDPRWTTGEVGARRVVRGGSFWFDARWCRSAVRDGWLPGGRFEFQGFRVARPPARP